MQALLAVVLACLLVTELPALNRAHRDLEAFRGAPICASAADLQRCRWTMSVTVDRVEPGSSQKGNHHGTYVQLSAPVHERLEMGGNVAELNALPRGATVLVSRVPHLDGTSLTYRGVTYEDRLTPAGHLDELYWWIGLFGGFTVFFAIWAVAALLGHRRPPLGKRHWLIPFGVAPFVAGGLTDAAVVTAPWAAWARTLGLTSLLALAIGMSLHLVRRGRPRRAGSGNRAA